MMKSTRLLPLRIMYYMVFVFVLSCSSDGSNSDSCGTTQAGDSCSNTSDCDCNLRCVGSVCVDPNTAQGDGDQNNGLGQSCPSGQVWSDFLNACVSDNSGGDGDGAGHNCPEGEIWSDFLGICIPISGDEDGGNEQPVVDTGVSFRLLDVQQAGSNIMLFVSVNRTPSATPITGLTSNNFTILEDSQSIGIESRLQVSAMPSGYVWRTLMLFDTSLSVLDQGQLPDVVEAIRGFAHGITDKDTRSELVAVSVFDGAAELRTVSDFTARQTILDSALDGLLTAECSQHSDCRDSARPQCEGGLCVDIATNLYGAVIKGIEKAESAITAETRVGMPRGSSVVVFTDGTDRAGRATLEEVQQTLGETNTYIFTVGVAGEVDTAALDTIGRDGSTYVQSIDQMSQGLEHISQVMQKVGQGIYLLSYCTPKRSGEHEITIKLNDYPEAGAITLTFEAQDEALCDQNAASQACMGKTCGSGGDLNFYCGDCAGSEYCSLEDTCRDACQDTYTYQTLECGTSPYDRKIDCGVCETNEYCNEDQQCKDACQDADTHQTLECGTSPYDDNVDCGTCQSTEVCTSSQTCMYNPYQHLVWQNPSAGGTRTWPNAITYCDSLTLDGHSDWRLPTISELRSLIRGCPRTMTGGACGVTDSCNSFSECYNTCVRCSDDGGPDNGCYWPDEMDGMCSSYWSSSYREANDSFTWGVFFNSGYVADLYKYNNHNVRCVRGERFNCNCPDFTGNYCLKRIISGEQILFENSEVEIYSSTSCKYTIQHFHPSSPILEYNVTGCHHDGTVIAEGMGQTILWTTRPEGELVFQVTGLLEGEAAFTQDCP